MDDGGYRTPGFQVASPRIPGTVQDDELGCVMHHSTWTGSWTNAQHLHESLTQHDLIAGMASHQEALEIKASLV